MPRELISNVCHPGGHNLAINTTPYIPTGVLVTQSQQIDDDFTTAQTQKSWHIATADNRHHIVAFITGGTTNTPPYTTTFVCIFLRNDRPRHS